MAAAKHCRNSLVFSGSWPATILAGLTDNDFPVTIAKKIRQVLAIKCTVFKMQIHVNFEINVSLELCIL